MTNRKWISSMALIDFIKCIIQGSDQCFLEMLDVPIDIGRCSKYYQEGKDLDETCYDCVCHWLNENFKKKI